MSSSGRGGPRSISWMMIGGVGYFILPVHTFNERSSGFVKFNVYFSFNVLQKE